MGSGFLYGPVTGIRSYGEIIRVFTPIESNQLEECNRFIPQAITTNLGAPGTISFKVTSVVQSGNRDIFSEGVVGPYPEFADLLKGKGSTKSYLTDMLYTDNFQAYCLIAQGDYGNADDAGDIPVKAIGFLTSLNLTPILNELITDSDGSATCSTVHAVLQTIPASIGDHQFYPVFNVRNDDGEIIGNQRYNWGSESLESKIQALILNQDELEDEHNVWNKYDIIKFLFHELVVSQIMIEVDDDYIENSVIEILKSKDEQYISSWDFDQFSLLQVLDTLITTSTNLRYDFVPILKNKEFKLKLVIYTIKPEERKSVWLSHRLMRFSVDGTTPYDKVEIIGNPVVVGGTFSFNQDTLQEGWDSNLEEQLIATDEDLTDFAEDNVKVRNKGKYDNVFSRFKLDTSVTNKNVGTVIYCDSNGTAKQVLHLVNKEGKDLDYNDYNKWDVGETYAMDGTRTSVLANIPWFKGIEINDDGETTDSRTGAQKANPVLHKIKIFRYDETDNEWKDLFNPADDTPTPQVNVTKNGTDIWIRYPNHPESLARTKWIETNDPKPSERDPTLNLVNAEAGDYQELRVTMAVETGSRLTKSKTREGGFTKPFEFGSPKVLTIRRPFDLWVMKSASIIELNGDGTVAKKLNYDTVIKDDTAKLNKLLDEISDYAFEVSSEVTVTYQGTERPKWAKLGFPIGTFLQSNLAENPGNYELNYDYDETTPWPYNTSELAITGTNSIVNSIREDFISNTITVTTQRPNPLSLFSSVQGSTKQSKSTQISKLTYPTKGKSVTVHEPQRASAASTPLSVFEIIHGNVIDTGSNKDGVKYISAIPEKLGPEWLDYTFEGVIEDDITLDDGFCIALNIATNSFVWYCHAPPQGVEWLDVWGGQRIYAPRTTSIPIKDGGTEVGSVTVRIPPGIY